MEREGIDFLYDTNTNNRSFLEMSYLLKQKNVVNNKFMLKLYDSTLSGVDVYSKSLTTEQKARIYQEICRNFWYFLREGLKIPAAGTTEGIRFQLNVGNMAAAFCCINNINHMLTVPRQVGKTVVEVSFSLWVFGFSGSYITETYLHKAQSGAVDNLRRLKQYKELLPDWLQELISANDDKDNLEEKVNSKRTNRIVALSSAQNDAAADKLGRGSSTAMVYMDEFAFLERNEIVWGALIPAWRTTAGVAKQNGAPYGIRITTTPNNLSLPHASFCYNMIKEKAARFTYANYDIPEDKFEEYLDNNSANGFFYIEYSWKECGKDQKWYNDQAKLMDAATVKRELENDWPESDEGSIFKDEQLDLIKHYLKDPLFTLNVNDYQIVFYERPDFLMNYIISCDVSGGLSQDRSVLLIIHPGDFHIVGSFINARIDTDSFRNLIFTLATQYFIHAIINIENNSYGLAILDVLMKNNLIEPRMYRETVERQGEKTLHDGTVVKSPMKKIQYGTNTNAKSRGLMFDILPGIVDEEPEVFVFKELYEEIKNLTRTNTGKIEARQGFHDDIVMAYLITRYSLAYGKCFRDRFNILPVVNMKNVRTGDNSQVNLTAQFVNIVDTMNTYDKLNDIGMLDDSDAELLAKDMIKKDVLMGYVDPKDKKKAEESSFFDMINRLNSNDDDDMYY